MPLRRSRKPIRGSRPLFFQKQCTLIDYVSNLRIKRSVDDLGQDVVEARGGGGGGGGDCKIHIEADFLFMAVGILGKIPKPSLVSHTQV